MGFAFFSMCCDNKPVEFYKLMLLIKLLPLLLVNSFVTRFRNDLGKGAKLWPPHIVILPKSVKQSPKQSIATKQKQKTRNKYQRILTHETFLTFLDVSDFITSNFLNGSRICGDISLKLDRKAYINAFVPNAPFLYPLKTSKNLTVFSCFQG